LNRISSDNCASVGLAQAISLADLLYQSGALDTAWWMAREHQILSAAVQDGEGTGSVEKLRWDFVNNVSHGFKTNFRLNQRIRRAAALKVSAKYPLCF